MHPHLFKKNLNHTAQKKVFWSATDLVTFTEEILNGKLHFLSLKKIANKHANKLDVPFK